MTKKWMTGVLTSGATICEKTEKHPQSMRGETLAETLVGLLIAALSIVMMTSAIATASRLVTKTRDMAEIYESSTRTLAPGAGASSGSVVITSAGNFGESYGTGRSVAVTYAESDLPGSIKGITYSQN